MPNFKNITATTDYTITGNDAKTNALASIVEMQVKRVIVDNEDMMGLRADATARSIIRQDGAGTSIYRIAERNVQGTDWDDNTGVQRQRTSALDTTVHIDQHITGELFIETFDLERFTDKANPIAVRASLVDDWIRTFTLSYLMSLDAIFIRGVMTSITAFANKRVNQIFKADPDAIANATDPAKAAKDFIVSLGKLSNMMRQLVSSTVIGTRKGDLRIVLSPKMYLTLATYTTNWIINDGGFKPLATGNLYENKLMGMSVIENTMFNNKFMKGTPTQLNKDLDFDFSNLHVMIYMDDAIAMPTGYEMQMMLLDNQTGSYKWLSKNMGSLPVLLRPEFVFIGLATLPTDDDIKAAQGLVWDGTDHSYNKHFQAADWDSATGFGTDGDYVKSITPAKQSTK